MLKDKNLKDARGGNISCKRAQTATQRDRNTHLFKARDEIKKHNAGAKVDLLTRRVVLPGDVPAYVQDKDGLGGKFASPFETCSI